MRQRCVSLSVFLSVCLPARSCRCPPRLGLAPPDLMDRSARLHSRVSSVCTVCTSIFLQSSVCTVCSSCLLAFQRVKRLHCVHFIVFLHSVFFIKQEGGSQHFAFFHQARETCRRSGRCPKLYQTLLLKLLQTKLQNKCHSRQHQRRHHRILIRILRLLLKFLRR